MPIYLRYYFWLVLITLAAFALERAFPHRREQRVLRDDLYQDLFWMAFNMQYLSWMMAIGGVWLVSWLNTALFYAGVPPPESARLIAHWPLWLQFVVFFPLKDFIEWGIHRSLHRVPWLWRLHELHHSIEQMDWVAAFRMHWAEMILYKLAIYLPLVILGVDDRVVFTILVLTMLVQELAHSNLSWDWGPLRYIVISPRFHAWHHDVEMHRKGGQNFGTTLAVWDFVFGTAHTPSHPLAPDRMGLRDTAAYPAGIWGRFWHPFVRGKKKGDPGR